MGKKFMGKKVVIYSMGLFVKVVVFADIMSNCCNPDFLYVPTIMVIP